MDTPRHCSRVLLAVAIALVAGAGEPVAAPASKLRIAPVPDWVEVHDIPRPGDGEQTGASYALLLDHQSDIGSSSAYSHIAIQILSYEGVQALSEFSIDHDPSYQTLLMHRLRLHRGSTIIDKLGVDELETMQRETSAERFLYDGTLTSSSHLSDVRVGDILEYSYTRIGRHPAYGGRAFDEFPLELTVPAELYLLRLRVPDGRKIELAYRNTGLEPETTRAPGLTIHDWRIEKLKPRVLDNNVPSWYVPFATVRYSEFANWDDVAAWAVPLFDVTAAERERLRAMTADVLTFDDSPDAVLAAIRFVQNDVRYLGLMQGMSAYRPHEPTWVWRNRYGDCKDKSVLLSALLTEMGAPAHPMLVRTTSAQSPDDFLIGPGAFDHCVVAFQYRGEQFFVDPTIANQGGNLAYSYFPPYGYGLIVSPGSTGLTKLPRPKRGRTSVTEHFQLDDSGGGTLSVATEYSGVDADIARSSLATHDLASIQQASMSYYATVYPEIRPEGDITIVDNRRDTDNVLMMTESYRLDHLWARDVDDTNTVFLRFQPLSLEELTTWNSSPNRTMPFMVSDSELRYEYIINIPGWMPVSPEDVQISGKGFEYHKQVSLQGEQVSVVHEYTCFVDHVEAADVADFINKHDLIRGNLSYVLIPGPLGAGGISRAMVVVAVLCAVGGAIIAFRVYRRFDPEPRPPRKEHGRSGIGGWLLLPALGLVATPIASIQQFAQLVPVFDARIAHGFGAGFTFLLGFELAAAVAGVVMWVLMLVSFVKLRSSVVVLFVAYIIAKAVLLLADLVLAHFLTPASLKSMESVGDPVNTLRAVLLSTLWVPYFLVSDRVRRTFVKRGPAYASLPSWQTAHVDAPPAMAEPRAAHSDDVEERAREMLKSGVPASEVMTWLTQQGLSPQMAALVINLLASKDR